MKKSFFEFYQIVKEASPVIPVPQPQKPGTMPTQPQAPAAGNQAQTSGQGVSPPIPQIFNTMKNLTPEVLKLATNNPELKAAWDKFNATLSQSAPKGGGTQPNAQQRPQTVAPTPAGSPPSQQATIAPHA